VEAPFPIVVGRSGLGWGRGLHRLRTDGEIKHEGDGRSPAGVYDLSAVFGFAPPAAAADLAMPYLQLHADTVCVDDPSSVHYNRVFDSRDADAVDWSSHEPMRDIPVHEWGVVVAHNASPVESGTGCCIFVHEWGGPDRGTAGCTGMSREMMDRFIHWLDAGKRPVIVQLPAAAYQELKAPWRLPDLPPPKKTEEAQEP